MTEQRVVKQKERNSLPGFPKGILAKKCPLMHIFCDLAETRECLKLLLRHLAERNPGSGFLREYGSKK